MWCWARLRRRPSCASESQTLTLSFAAFDMASFDAYDKDGDGHKGLRVGCGQL